MSDTSKPQTLLELKGLGKTFPVGAGFSRKRLHVLQDVSFSMRRGEIIALVGESGSGKSTIARIIARLMDASEGELLLDGKDVLVEERRGASLAYRRRVQMIFQDPFGSLNPAHTVAYHLERPLVRHKIVQGRKAIRERIHDLLETVGLVPAATYAEKRPDQLSGGQRQRVAIARALAVEPELIIADEPTSMLDVSLRMGVLNLMDKLRRERGVSYLFITHDLASARYLADRIMVLYAGQVVESATSDTLIEEPSHPYTRLLLSSVPNPRGSIQAEPTKSAGGALSLSERPPGCPFAARCPDAFEPCHDNPAAVASLNETHWARCHLYEPNALAAKEELSSDDNDSPESSLSKEELAVCHL